MALNQTQVSQLYVSIFNRASEGEGNTNWQTKGTMAAAANLMLADPAAKEYFGSSLDDNKEFIKTIYKNTLNKTLADDAAGIENWTAKLNNGMGRGEVVAELIEAIYTYAPGEINYNPDDQKTINAYNQFINRVEVSNYMALHVEKAPADYKTTTQFAPLGELDVTADPATVKTAKEKIDAANPANIGKTFTLTAGVDTITGSALDDMIKGVVSGISSDNTLNVADVIDGGEGTDTLSVTMSANFSGMTAGSVKNVEVLDITNGSASARSFDTTGISGLKTVKVDTNDQAFTVADLESTNLRVELSNADEAKTVALAYATLDGASVNAGTSDSLALTLNDVGTAEVKNAAGTVTADQKTLDVVAAGIEDLTISSNGTSNFFDASIGDSKTITIDGAAALKVKAVDTTVTSVDASAATGDMTLDLSGATVQTVKTGSGNDTVTVNKLNIEAVLAGGEGTDTLVLKNVAGPTYQPVMTGFETIKLDGQATPITIAGKASSDLSTIQVHGNLGTAAVTFAEFNNSAINIDFVDTKGATVVAGGATINYTSAADVTINATTNNAAGSIRAYDDNVTAANATSVALNVAKDVNFTGNVTAANATSANINIAKGGSLTTGTVTVAKATTVNFVSNDTTAITALNIQADKATTVDINTKSNTMFGAADDFSSVQTMNLASTNLVNTGTAVIGDKSSSVSIDASGVKGAFTTNLAAYTAGGGSASIKGSTLAINNITIGLGRNEIAVTGGMLTDNVIVSQGFAPTDAVSMRFDLGTGAADTVTFTNGANITNGTVTFAGVDNITATAGTLTMNASSVSGQTIILASTANTLKGTASADTIVLKDISATTGNLTVDAGAGNDTITASDTIATQIINGEEGNDIITIGAVAATVNGGDGNDTITGGTGNDTITGGKGNDTITGGAGTDTITGGLGVDTMTGGAGIDTFIFGAADAIAGTELDVITDFNASATGDILQFTGATPTLIAAIAGPAVAGSVTLTAGGKIGFHADDNTYALKVAAIQANASLDAINTIAFFEDSNNTYVYHAGAAIGNADDQIIQLTGVTGLATITVDAVTTTNITIA